LDLMPAARRVGLDKSEPGRSDWMPDANGSEPGAADGPNLDRRLDLMPAASGAFFFTWARSYLFRRLLPICGFWPYQLGIRWSYLTGALFLLRLLFGGLQPPLPWLCLCAHPCRVMSLPVSPGIELAPFRPFARRKLYENSALAD
jgi:hypothetical protein